MPRNGSGSYSRVAGTPYVYNTAIDQIIVNNEMDDIATALTNSVAKNGETTMTANLPMGGYKLTGLAAGTGNGDSIRHEQVATSAALRALVFDETGGGALVFAESPTLVTPILGTPTSGDISNCTGSPTLTAPALGTPTALVGTNITGTAAALNIGGNAATATTATTATNAGTSGTFTITGTGFTVDPTATATWRLNNRVVDLFIPFDAITGTADSASFSLTGLPSGILTTSNQWIGVVLSQDNGVTGYAHAYIAAGASVINIYRIGGWTASGTRYLHAGVLHWTLD